MATVWGVVGLNVAVPPGAAWAPGHWEELQRAGHHSGFGHGLPAAARAGELREQRELFTQVIKAWMFYTSEVSVGRVSNPKSESSSLGLHSHIQQCLLSNYYVPGAL